MTLEQEAAYVLGYNLSPADLTPEVREEYDRLLAKREANRSRAADLASSDPSPRHLDYVEKWLASRYQMASQDCDRVKAATYGGVAVSDPRLREAVCGLASVLLAKRLPMPGILFDYVIGGVLGVPMLVLILMPAFSSGDYLTLAILSTTAGAPHIITFFVARPRRRLKLVAKALRLNSGIEGLPEP